MSKLIIKRSLIAAIFVGYSSLTHGQHTQVMHESMVDDFYTPYPFSLSRQQKFTGTIGELKRKEGGDLWDYYVFQTVSPGKIEIVLDGFSKPVNLGLEQGFPTGHSKSKTVEESLNRVTDSHSISTRLSPLTTYYIAVGSGLLENSFTPYSLTVKFTEAESSPAAPAATGEYALQTSGAPCGVSGFESASSKLPVYVVSEQGAAISSGNEQQADTDERIHEMFRFEPAYGMLVHEFSDLHYDEDPSMLIQRDVVVMGRFEDGSFHGEIREHDIIKDLSETLAAPKSKECSRQVTAVGR